MPRPTNPILSGFHPDPSIVKVDEIYYLATSTFEWYPGVAIYASTDLVNWRLAARPLDRAALLDLRGRADSGGVWAPCLTYADGLFWLVYTDMIRHQGNYKDCRNWLTTAQSIAGPWSDPVFLNGSGFDPSLFHDEDGLKYLVNVLWDPFAAHPFSGIGLQQYDPAAKKLVGPVTSIFSGTDLAFTEGPHLYKRNGWYYLLTAEGGTWFEHAVTLARSRSLRGPFEVHPDNPVLTAHNQPEVSLFRAGHGDIVDTPDGRSYLVHLCSRKVGEKGVSILGRETAIQECEWRDNGWLYVVNGPAPSDSLASLPQPAALPAKLNYRFDSPRLDADFMWLRTPETARIFEVDATKHVLRLFGRESLGSWNEVALVARRQDVSSYVAETSVSFAPEDVRELAGLTAFYSRYAFYALGLTCDAHGGRQLRLLGALAENHRGTQKVLAEQPLDPGTDSLGLRVEAHEDRMQFFWRHRGAGPWQSIGPELDASILSDDAGAAAGGGGVFTGAFCGVFVSDLNGHGKSAEFDHFDYCRGNGN